MTMTAGAPSPLCAMSSGSVASVATATRCAGQVPHSMTATGVSGERPAAMTRSRMARALRNPHQHDDRVGERNMQGRACLVCAQWPATTATDVATPRSSNRDARIRGRGQRGGNTGHNLKPDAGGAQRARLFRAPPEQQRVASLQPNDDVPAMTRVLDPVAARWLSVPCASRVPPCPR